MCPSPARNYPTTPSGRSVIPLLGIQKRTRGQSGFTLIELVTVIGLMAILSAFTAWRLGNFQYWHEESFLRKFTETIVFLHHQAMFDQVYYALEIDLEDPKHPTYKVGVFNPEPPVADPLAVSAASLSGGNLSNALADFLSPSIGTGQTFTEPHSFPSLAQKVDFPTDMTIEDIRTMRGKQYGRDGGKIYVMFSPRGFSEFAVFHLLTSQNTPVTILVNPFTGNTEIMREYKDFKWTYSKRKDD